MISHSRSKQRGLAAVEIAIATPALLVMLLISAEFTRVFYEFNTLTKSVRDAARWAADDTYTAGVFDLSAETILEAKNIAVYGKINGGGTPLLDGLTVGNITIAQRDLGTAPAVREHVQVTADYNFQPLAPVISKVGFLSTDIGMNFTLTASSTMRAL